MRMNAMDARTGKAKKDTSPRRGRIAHDCSQTRVKTRRTQAHDGAGNLTIAHMSMTRQDQTGTPE